MCVFFEDREGSHTFRHRFYALGSLKGSFVRDTGWVKAVIICKSLQVYLSWLGLLR